MPKERAKKFTRHDEKSISHSAQTYFPSEQKVNIFFFSKPPCPHPVIRHCEVV